VEQPPTIDILMATFNGESWINVQLATIFAQDYPYWQLIIRDDGSTDSTREQIKWWRDRYPNKIHFVDEDDPTNLGVARNFSALLHASTAPYSVLASWDDVWYPDRLSKMIVTIRGYENELGTNHPLLLHSALRMVKGNLQEIDGSAHRHQGLVPYRKIGLGTLCLENQVYGCTIMLNCALREIGKDIPAQASCEDWWLALVATCFGTIIYLPRITIDWRRHGKNDSATHALRASMLFFARNPLVHIRSFLSKTEPNRAIIGVFLERFFGQLKATDRDTLQGFLNLPNSSWLQRRALLVRHRILYSSLIRSVGLLLLV
jgi:glycosyltransferase involved in cell wall biosynthesis